MGKVERRTLILTLALLDTLAFMLALALAYYLRIIGGLFDHSTPASFGIYGRIIVLAIPIWLLICASARLYDGRIILSGYKEYAQVIKACTFTVIALIVLSFVGHDADLSRGWLLLSWALSITLVSGTRFVMRRLIGVMRQRGRFVRRVLIVGATEYAKVIADQFRNDREAGLEVVGFLDDYLPPGARVMGTLEVLGSPLDLEQVARQVGATEVVVLPNALSWESCQHVVSNAASAYEGLDIKLCPSYYEILTTNVQVSHQAAVPLLSIEQVRITGVDAVLKRAMDLALGAALLVLAAPLMVVIALALLVADGVPVFDRLEVLGLRGHPFRTLKFRTGLARGVRRSLACPASTALDPQAYPSCVGRFLFTTGLDKLPQLFDVLRGEMSLVGPRTVGVTTDERYNPWRPSILTVRPGMTGPWAVHHAATQEDEERLSVYYIRNWSLWFDLQILAQTVWRILRLASRDLAEKKLPSIVPAQLYGEGNVERQAWIQ